MTSKDIVVPENYSQSYRRQWVMTFAIAAGVIGFYWYQTHVFQPHPPAPIVTNQVIRNYFYVLRMPETQVHADVRSSRLQFAKWMEALQHEGFQIFLLSDILSQLGKGISLPEKSVVLVFDPGYRRTADTFIPVLKEKKIPAVWLTNDSAIEHNDKRYVSAHQIQVMQTSGLWDVGYFSPNAGVTLETRNGEQVLLGRRSPWKPEAGRVAINRGIPVDAFDRLNVNAKWTEEDLVHRLLVERPVVGSTLLSLQQIQGRNWGIGLDVDAAHDTRFTLRAEPEKRSGSLYWLGTLGLNDVHLRMDVKSLTGELRLILRSDTSANNDVSVIFAKGKVSVDKTTAGKVRRLSSVPCPDLMPNTPFNAVLAVMGRQLALAVNGHPLAALDSLDEPTSTKGMIRLVVQDSLKGVGEARSVRIICTPLGKK